MNAVLHRVDNPLAEACAALEHAKAAEAAATLARRRAEEVVISAMPPLPDEGSTKAEAGGWKATVTTSIRRTVDADKLAEIAQSIPEAIGKRLIRWSPELVTRELRFVESNEPDIYMALAPAVTAKPGKPAVKVERAKEAV